jgi:hypothetical protein
LFCLPQSAYHDSKEGDQGMVNHQKRHKNHLFRILPPLLALLAPTSTLKTFDLTGYSFISPRSQSENAARDMAGLILLINRTCQDENYQVLSVTPEYSLLFHPRRVGQYFFNTNYLTFSGSESVFRKKNDILADYFGLSPSFDGTVLVRPAIKTFSADIAYYIGFDNWVSGLYARVHAPIVWTEWEMELITVNTPDRAPIPFPPLYMGLDAVNPAVYTIQAALAGNVPFGDNHEGLQFGRIAGSRCKQGLSDIQWAVGYNFINRELGHVGFNLRGSVPTGNRSTARFLFEPMVGNGHHWELGLGFTSHGIIWECDDNQQIGIYTDINITHLFPSNNIRSFDLCRNGFGSRYMLAKEFDSNGVYNGNLVPLINRTSLLSSITVDVQIDIAIMFAYHYDGYEIDLGYNGWARSREIICLKERFPNNKFGLKGLNNVYFSGGAPNNFTDSFADLHGHSIIDDPVIIANSNSPVFITESDLNLQSAANPAVLTHKFFTHFGYTCNALDDTRTIKPFFGIGAEVEFEGIHPYTAEANKNTISQWGMWLKGGVGF